MIESTLGSLIKMHRKYFILFLDRMPTNDEQIFDSTGEAKLKEGDQMA